MATARVCDRCWSPVVNADAMCKLTVSMVNTKGEDVYKIPESELCENCAKLALGKLKGIKLGLDKVVGGVRKGKAPGTPRKKKDKTPPPPPKK